MKTPRPNPYVEELVPYEPGRPITDVAREYGLDPSQIAKLASNENPLGPSPTALQAIRDGLPYTHLYPDGGGLALREAIAKLHGLTRDHVVLGCGSNEIIEFCYHAFTRPGEGKVLASAYAFAVYGLMAKLFGIPFEEVPDREFHHDLAGFVARLSPEVRLVFLASPNNPTGTRIPNAELSAFVEKFPAGPLLVLDEAYYEFIPEPPPSVQWVKEGRPVVVLRTFSKVQGLAGLRIGYGLARPDIAAVLQKSRQPFNTSAPAQAAALAALSDTEHVRKTVALTHTGLERLQGFLKKQGLRFVPGTANFVMVEVGDGDAVFRELQKRGLIVRSRLYRLNIMSSNSWNVAIAEDVIATLRDEPGPVLIALQAIQEKFGFVHEDALQLIADAFNVSRAEVFGVFTYYHDLKKAPQSEKAVKICAAEACQAVGCDKLIAEAEAAGFEVEKAYCFGNCALGPAAMVGDRLIGRATVEKLK